MTLRAALALGILATPACALDLALPGDAVLAHDSTVAAGRHSLPTGPAQAGAVPMRQLEGDLRHRVWHLEPPVSVDLLLATLRPQVEEAGYRVLLDCNARACGGFDFRRAINDVGPPDMMVDLGRYGYLAAQHGPSGIYATLLVSEMQSLGYLQLTEIVPGDIGLAVAPDTASETVPAAPPRAEPSNFARMLLSEGRAVLEDLRFAPGSAALEDGSYPSLTALAGFLSQHPDQVIALVGHTDSQGSTDINRALSLQRAEAVRDRLISEYAAPTGQVRAEGVGYLAPRASNRTEDGRRANRRVEAVLTQP